MTNLAYTKFSDIDLADPFFDSLKADYREFPDWFDKKAKAGERAYIIKHGGIRGFLYLKFEDGVVTDVVPSLPAKRHLKVGTLKIDAHGTRLGQRFVKKVFDHALAGNADDAYVTVFAKHLPLISILKTYGFKEFAKKNGLNGEELVLLKSFREKESDILLNYPRVSRDGVAKALLAIYPEYHTKFLPDSKLKTENFDIVQDVSHANSIHKIYISGVAATGKLNRGDLLVMYRTTDIPGKAYFRSVATSIGVVEEVKRIGAFPSRSAFLHYVSPYSVFSSQELTDRFTKKRHIAIKFTYNIALTKRLNRARLLEEVGLPGNGRRWDFLRLSDQQFNEILNLGQVNESYLID
ncbi:N-acetyltransferase [Paraburkholderia sp. SARCC-3016]|uniref:N-acetyltransferase n=1 Tax=Paraburkholderia sp. SARCC-3016 TaxID=3058611 RepID=UPI002807D9D6|nr:N-acetyltransferase [Paraburkholderia sp. SARCC-3016]MDQ7979049.1 N-acetyltransferase [Paraburkholderia sp. SARCC-3016]